MSLNQPAKGSTLQARGAGRRVIFFTLTLLAIEFLDEFVDGVRGAAWPLIHADLQLSYVQIGMLLTLPNIIGNLIEPIMGILGDMGKRRTLILGGGVAFALSVLLVALSYNFSLLLIAFVLFYPASGAFVSLSQAALMDINPARHQQNMARWTLSGSVGVLVGQLALSMFVSLGWGWRDLFFGAAGLALLLLAAAWRFPFATPNVLPDQDAQTTQSLTATGSEHTQQLSWKQGVYSVVRSLRRPEVLRWLTLLQFSDLMLDILHSFLALYFVYEVGVTEAQAALAVTVWIGVGLLGDLLLIPLLERVHGLSYLRLSALLVFALFPTFLLVPDVAVKLTILGLLGFFSAGWYSILQGQLYSTMPGQSSTVMAVGNVFGWIGSLIPLGLGLVADQYGLGIAMWLLLLGPVALLIGIPPERANTISL